MFKNQYLYCGLHPALAKTDLNHYLLDRGLTHDLLDKSVLLKEYFRRWSLPMKFFQHDFFLLQMFDYIKISRYVVSLLSGHAMTNVSSP